MRKFTVLALVALIIPSLAEAKVFNLGDDAPVASIDVPDTWNPEIYENGVSGTSPDDTYMFAQVVKADDLASAVTEGITYLQEQGVTLDDATMKSANVKMGALDVVMREWHGKDKEGEAVVTLGAVILNPDQMMLVVSWASPESDEINGPDMKKMIESIVPAAK